MIDHSQSRGDTPRAFASLLLELTEIVRANVLAFAASVMFITALVILRVG